jgi:hypothetical protein
MTPLTGAVAGWALPVWYEVPTTVHGLAVSEGPNTVQFSVPAVPAASVRSLPKVVVAAPAPAGRASATSAAAIATTPCVNRTYRILRPLVWLNSLGRTYPERGEGRNPRGAMRCS